MIKDPVIAQEISGLMLEFSERLDKSIATVPEHCSSDEFRIYRRAVGHVLGEMLLQVLNPLYVQHPNLKPPGLD